MTAVLVTIVLIGLLVQLGFAHRKTVRALRLRDEQRPAPLASYPAVTVIRPVKGVDVEQEANFRAALDTGYTGDVETIFILEDEEDPAYPLVCRAIESHVASGAHGSARIVLAGKPPAGRTGKINNMIVGEAEARGDIYTQLYLRTLFLPQQRLAEDRPRDIVVELEAARALRHDERFQMHHWWSLGSDAQRLLYEGRGPEADELVRRTWSSFRRSLLLTVGSWAVRTPRLPLKADFSGHGWHDGYTITYNGAEADFFEIMGHGESTLLWSIAHDLGVVECWLLGQHTLHRAFDLPDVLTDLGETRQDLHAVAESTYAANDVWPGGEGGDFEVSSDFLGP